MPEPMRTWTHGGFEAFSKGRFEDGGSNLYVNARGIIETIHRTDIDDDGYVDIVLPNHQGYAERGPTWIYRPGAGDGEEWSRRELPNDSGWMSRIADLDGDGHADLVVVNGENGVTSELESYVYWGGPDGLTGERAELPTVGSYDVAVVDVDGDGLLDLVFPSAWVDHHNPGRPRPLQVYRQLPGRQFEDASERCALVGVGALALAAGDLNGDGHTDLVVANYRADFAYDTDSFVYWGTADGFDTDAPLRLPSRAAVQALVADLNGDGWPEIVFCGHNTVQIYWNEGGAFHPDHRLFIEVEGLWSEFRVGSLHAAAADVDGDGHTELIIAAQEGLQIRRADDLETVAQLLRLPYAHQVHAADLNGDGRPELIASRYEDGYTHDVDSIIFWNGPGGFDAERVTRLPTHGAVGITAGDLDGDDEPVVVVNNTMIGFSKSNPVLPSYIYLGGVDAGYRVERRLELPVGGSNGCALVDCDLDGYPDFVFSRSDGLRLFPNGPQGPHPERFYDLPCRLPNHQVADLNRDGWLDLLVLSQTYDDRPETMASSSVIYYGSAEGYSVERSEILPTYCSGVGYLADVTRNGWLDILVCDKRGYVAIYLGSPEGYSPDRVTRIAMFGKDWKGSLTAAADLNHDGWLDLIVGTSGHLTRTPDTFTIFYGGPDGYSWDRSQHYQGGYTPGRISVADLNNDGNLDLIIPAYSTDLTRVLPVQVFWNDGERVDLEHPLDLPADSGFSALPVDLNRNGYIDVMLACHRSNVSHKVDSLIYWNGPEGLSPERTTRLPGMGPHRMNARDPGNAYTREPYESYVSPPHDSEGLRPVRIWWEAEVPETTDLRFQLRFAGTEQGLASAPWLGPGGEGAFYETTGEEIPGTPHDGRWLQYRAVFTSLYGCRSPKLREVRIDLA